VSSPKEFHRFCPACGAEAEPGASYCGDCGRPVLKRPVAIGTDADSTSQPTDTQHLVGSTEALHSMSVREMATMLRRFEEQPPTVAGMNPSMTKDSSALVLVTSLPRRRLANCSLVPSSFGPLVLTVRSL